jgi:hypothetical protein
MFIKESLVEAWGSKLRVKGFRGNLNFRDRNKKKGQGTDVGR